MPLSTLKVYKQAQELAVQAYEFCEDLPDEEKYGLKSQLQRSASSIPANIAEGYGRRTNADQVRFYFISKSSPLETLGHLELCEKLKYGSEEKNKELRKKYKDLDVRVFNYIKYVEKRK